MKSMKDMKKREEDYFAQRHKGTKKKMIKRRTTK